MEHLRLYQLFEPSDPTITVMSFEGVDDYIAAHDKWRQEQSLLNHSGKTSLESVHVVLMCRTSSLFFVIVGEAL